MRRLLLLFCVLLSASGVEAAIYYVATTGSDSNSCTQSSPCRTIAKGRTMLASGDTLYIRSGTYFESIFVQTSNNLPSGSSWNTATIIAGYPGETVTLTGNFDFNFAIGGPPGLARYIIIENFIFDGGSIGALGCGHPVDMSCGPHFIRWQNLEFKNNPHVAVGNGFGASDLEYLNIFVHDQGTTRLTHAFYVGSPRSLYDNVHTRNTQGYGMHMYDEDPQCAGQCNTDSIIRNSRFEQSHGDGAVTMNHGANMQFYNNIVYNNDHGGLAGICYGAMTNNTQVYNNTFYGNGGSAIATCAGGGVTNTVIKNNLFHNNVNNIDDRGVGSVFANNLCGSLGPHCEVVGDPAFTDAAAGDFTLQASSAARNAGVTLTTFNTDRIGTPRPQGSAWDIGAYESPAGGGQPPPGPPLYVGSTSENVR
jgi:Right handed beta helix region